MKYLLDANVLIQAYKGYYSFDIVPKFWKILVVNSDQEKIYTVNKVKNELLKQTDSLSQWTKEAPKSFFLSENDPAVIKQYRKLQSWANTQQQYNGNAKEEFAKSENADPWILSYAMVNKNEYTIVTHELFDSKIKSKIKIPNVCKIFDVKCINTFDMLRELEIVLS